MTLAFAGLRPAEPQVLTWREPWTTPTTTIDVVRDARGFGRFILWQDRLAPVEPGEPIDLEAARRLPGPAIGGVFVDGAVIVALRGATDGRQVQRVVRVDDRGTEELAEIPTVEGRIASLHTFDDRALAATSRPDREPWSGSPTTPRGRRCASGRPPPRVRSESASPRRPRGSASAGTRGSTLTSSTTAAVAEARAPAHPALLQERRRAGCTPGSVPACRVVNGGRWPRLRRTGRAEPEAAEPLDLVEAGVHPDVDRPLPVSTGLGEGHGDGVPQRLAQPLRVADVPHPNRRLALPGPPPAGADQPMGHALGARAAFRLPTPD
jgi:hypothetical protein